MQEPELIVVGAGAAGLFASLMAAGEGARVTLVSARPLAETASYWAQGGLAAALAIADSPEKHLEDTLVAGRGLVRRSAAEVLTQEAGARFRDLEDLGVVFDADRQGQLELGLEGGHSERRVLHAGGSATGRRILRQLSARVAEHELIHVLEGRRARALINDGGRCDALALDDGSIARSRAVILATGGTAAMWSRTTNPPGSFGSGMMLARAVGARLADLEFIQFHPTAITGIAGIEGFLVTEAVRGEGATLLDHEGNRFVDELQPRDAVSRAIHHKLRETGHGCVYLDMREIDPARFPNVVQALRDAGHDPATQLVPVSPATHYAMGGVITDLHGRAEGVKSLYAIGEVACTGLHGANRLASNSLTECFVFGRRAALAALDEPPPAPGAQVIADPGDQAPAPSRETREAMWRQAGLERSAAELEPLLEDPHPLARLIAACAIAREETRGAHARSEFPEVDPELDGVHTVLDPVSERPRFEPWGLS